MIKKHLGTTIDIHGGGSDLTFPHHENESAQSRCANGNPEYVRYWLHNGMLTLGAEKMSKSVGNVRTIRDLALEYNGEVLRYALLAGQHRSPLAWSPELIEQAAASLDTLYQALRDKPSDAPSDSAHTKYAKARIEEFPTSVVNALCDDLNTPEALAAMHELATDLQKAAKDDIQQARDKLLAGGWLLGLLNDDPEEYFKTSRTGSEHSSLSDGEIDALIEERNQARSNKDFARADEIRDQLTEANIELEDLREGTRWRRV